MSNVTHLIKQFCVQSYFFLNKFNNNCEEKLQMLSSDIRRLETALIILEAKLSSLSQSEDPLSEEFISDNEPDEDNFLFEPEDAPEENHSFAGLYSEILLHIASFLSAKDIVQLSLVNRRIFEICQDATLWRGICKNKTIANGKLLHYTWKMCFIESCIYKRYEQQELELYQSAWKDYHSRVKKIKSKRSDQATPVENLPDPISEANTPISNSNPTQSSIFNKFLEIQPKHIEEYIRFHRICTAYHGLQPPTMVFLNKSKGNESKKVPGEYIFPRAKERLDQSEWPQNFLENGLYRYQLFLLLKAKYRENLLIPTLCIEFIWQSHLLRFDIYKRDCEQLFGRIIDHHLLLTPFESLHRNEAIKQTALLWEREFGFSYGIELNDVPDDPTFQEFVHNHTRPLPSDSPPTELLEQLPSYYEFPANPNLIQDFPKGKLLITLTLEDLIFDCDWIGYFDMGIHSIPFLSRLNANYVHYFLGLYYENFIRLTSEQLSCPERHQKFVPPPYVVGMDLFNRVHKLFPLRYLRDWKPVIGSSPNSDSILASAWYVNDERLYSTRALVDLYESEYVNLLSTVYANVLPTWEPDTQM